MKEGKVFYKFRSDLEIGDLVQLTGNKWRNNRNKITLISNKEIDTEGDFCYTFLHELGTGFYIDNLEWQVCKLNKAVE